MSYLKSIKEDFVTLTQVLNTKFGSSHMTDEISQNFESFHRSLIIYKDLFNDISEKLPASASRAFDLSISDFLDFIWLLYLGRYKASMAALRTGLDIFSRGAIRTFPEIRETDSFAQNLQLTMKSIRVNNEQSMDFSSTRKIHKRFIEDSFTSPLQKYYGELSDSIHGKETIIMTLPDYINDVLDLQKNYDEDVLVQVMLIAKEVMSLILQVFIILNFKSLNTYSNLYKLDIVISLQDNNLKKYKYEFLMDFKP